MRTDTHRPSFIRPEDYAYVGFIYQGASDEAWEAISDFGRDPEYRKAIEALETSPFDGNHKNRGTCDHCGSAFAYGAVYKHNPSGEHICVGHICAYETLGVDTRRDLELKRLKSRLAAQKKLLKLRAQAAAFLAESCPELEPVLGFEAEPEHHIIRDIQHRLWNNYPSLSPAQLDLVRKILAEEAEPKPAPEPERPREKVPIGVVEVEGELVSIRNKEGYYGPVVKMLVVDDRGFKVWGTLPTALYEAERGDRVKFTATLEASKDDPHFGFFKRPRKAELVSIEE